MKKRTVRTILLSAMLIILCVALVASFTFALFTGGTAINVSVKSGEVNVQAEISDFKIYSAVKDSGGELEDENHDRYSYREYTSGGKFANGGSAQLESDGSVSFKGVSAGDKVSFTINLENKSSIKIKYNTLLTLIGQDKNKLFEVLSPAVVTDGVPENPKADAVVTDGMTELNTYKYNSNTVRSGWVGLIPGQSGKVTVSMAIPVTATNPQGITAKIKCTLSAVQSTSALSGVAEVNGEDCESLQLAVALAKNGDTIEIVRGDTRPVGKLTFDKSVSLTSADGESYSFKDAQIEVISGSSVSFDGLTFTGESVIDASKSSSVKVKNCVIDSSPVAVYDEGNRVTVERPAFIASSGVQQSGIKLEIINNTFKLNSKDGNAAAVYTESRITDGSVISGNTFGTADEPLTGFAVDILSVANGATIDISDNTFYGANAVQLSQKYSNYGYKVKLSANAVYCEGAASLVKISDGVRAQVYDNGSEINGAPAELSHIIAGNRTLFCGVNVTFDNNGLITGGRFALVSVNEETFNSYYKSPAAAKVTIEK